MLIRHIFLQGVKRLVLLQFMMNFDLCSRSFCTALSIIRTRIIKMKLY